MEEERLWDMISDYGDQVSELLQEIEALKNEIQLLKDEVFQLKGSNCKCNCHKLYNHNKFWVPDHNDNAIYCCNC